MFYMRTRATYFIFWRSLPWETTQCQNALARFALSWGRTNTPFAVVVVEMLSFVIITRRIWKATAARTAIESGK